MNTCAYIRRYVYSLRFGELFTTRDVLNTGSRNAVDKCLSRLVKSGLIDRIARGVFAKQDPVTPVLFSIKDVATAKAESFGKVIVSYGKDAAAKLGLCYPRPGEHLFFTSGSSSTFRYGPNLVRFKRCCPRKILLGESKVGLLVRAVTYLGRSATTPQLIMKACQILDRTSRRELRQRASFMPAWLSDFFAPRDYKPMKPPA